MTEIDALRAENEQLRANLRATERECEILHSLHAARSAGGPVVARSVQIGSRERMAMLEHAIDVLDGFAREMASYDCYGCEPDSLCKPCRAEAALAAIPAWRYDGAAGSPARRFEGAMHYRTSNGWNPRESKIHAAWKKHMETTAMTARSVSFCPIDPRVHSKVRATGRRRATGTSRPRSCSGSRRTAARQSWRPQAGSIRSGMKIEPCSMSDETHPKGLLRDHT